MKTDVGPSTPTPEKALDKAVADKKADPEAPSVATKSGGGGGGGGAAILSSDGDSADRSAFEGRDIAFKVYGCRGSTSIFALRALLFLNKCP